MSSNPSSGGLGAGRQLHSRTTSSHGVLSSSLNGNRVSRRKSVTSANLAAVAAALEEAGDKATPLPIAIGSRRNTTSKNGGSRPSIGGSLPSPPASLPIYKNTVVDMQGSAIEDDPNDGSADDESTKENPRVRRASDGQSLVKEGRKSNRPDLHCDKCGKGYKHSSCLTKHLWEHTPEWAYTSKLLISKHQQVQLLEAASVLVAMNNTTGNSTTTPPDSARDFNSEPESASPAASGYSDMHDRSSVDTTPPPQSEAINVDAPYRILSQQNSSGGGFARSYQSAPSNSSLGSVPGFGHFRQLSQEKRPMSSGENTTGQEDRDLAAAVELLSCSLNSNGGSRKAYLHDAPPVPPLPAQYLDQAALVGPTFINSFPTGAPESFTRGEIHRVDVKMEDTADSTMDDDDEDELRSRGRSDEDDDGVFGKMEE